MHLVLAMRRHLLRPLATSVLAVAVIAACGQEDPVTAAAPAESAVAADDTAAAPTESATPEPTPAPPPETEAAGPSAAEAEALLDELLLTAEDLGDGWVEVSEELAMPHDADIARSLPSCAAYAELVFEGGTQNLAARSKALGRQQSMTFIYGVVFENADQAAAMVSAVASPDFDPCWADFNAAAVLEMPFSVTEASYTSADPPTFDLDADSVAVKHLTGSFTVGGSEVTDSCVCVFAQVDRVVVALHSAEIALGDEVRTETLQAGIDKARRVLGLA